MKKTVTTILSLALALILVSSLSSGVILAKGDDDHDNKKKNKNKYETVIDVAIMDCLADNVGDLKVSAFDSHVDAGPAAPMIMIADFCGPSLFSLLEVGFRIQSETSVAAAGGMSFGNDPRSRYTFLRKRRELRD